ncbi:MAG: T9SS type A sorting domain-containing protein [Bacteroidia bacterium]|nr:T9SS type A sorting domain-containing protein [Bacteroidia bacterium]
MKTSLLSIALLMTSIAFGQAPKLYIHIVSHNEPNENLQTTLKYAKAKANILQLANIVNSKNVRWNLQTSDGFVIGALNDQATTGTNIFKTLANPPYNDNIEIDPRQKNMGGRNIADQWYLLDSLGANPTTHLGGCIYYTTNPNDQPIDWEQYRNPIIGNIYGNTWQCSIITGAGSSNHKNDLNDFGIFKPDTATNFYHHNPAKNLWCMGTGCAPVLDSLDDEQAIIDLIQGQVDSIQNGLWPSNKFYVTRIMTNQREYGPLFFQKISKVIDSLNLIPSSKLQWATVSEVFTAFQAWQITSGLDHSQWLCGQTTTTGLTEEKNLNYFTIYPNPSSGNYILNFADNINHQIKIYDLMGRLIQFKIINGNDIINLSNQADGLYILKVDEKIVKKIIKE